MGQRVPTCTPDRRLWALQKELTATSAAGGSKAEGASQSRSSVLPGRVCTALPRRENRGNAEPLGGRPRGGQGARWAWCWKAAREETGARTHAPSGGTHGRRTGRTTVSLSLDAEGRSGTGNSTDGPEAAPGEQTRPEGAGTV